jgi:DNA processing protein
MNQPSPRKTDHMLNDAEKLAWLQLIRTENVGPITFYNFIEYYGSAQKALEAIPDLAARGGRKKPLNVPPLSLVEREYDAIRKMGGQIVCACEPDYQLALSANEDAPPVLTMRGHAGLMHKPCVAIVGARNASLNGRKMAERLARDLGAAGQIITSGLARGIDTAAHAGAIDSGTIAVVAGGLDVVYPPENQKLYDEIAEKGLIIAENPPGTPPRSRDFPRRNRIVSGLSQGVIVIEATLRSGSLITARLAGEQGRDVYAVPGSPLDPRAEGPNHLIRDGAVLVRHAEDVLEHLSSFGGSHTKQPSFHLEENIPAPYQPQIIEEQRIPDEQTLAEAREEILTQLSYTPVNLDELARCTGLPVPTLMLIIIELELAGSIQRLPGNRVVRL